MQEEKLLQLALTQVSGLGDVLIKTLISYLGSPEKVFGATVNQLTKVPGIGMSTARAIATKNLNDARIQMDLLMSQQIELYFFTDDKYPKRLKNIYDAPAMLYYNGHANLNHARMLAVVGTRNATSHGKAFVQSLIKGLAANDLIIVSGLAYGIDIEAHKTALEYDIPTIGVIASGMDIIYPQVHAKYAKKMIDRGGLVTEYPLKTKLDPARFPARNRIIAGLTDATVVVEAADKGGALITADLASGYDREVFAVPGRWNDQYSFGCNQLIKNNIAQSITSAEDVEFYMQWTTENIKEASSKVFDPEDFNSDEWIIINTIEKAGKEIHIDDLSWRSQIQISQLAGILLNLEFRGIVSSVPGKKYILN